MKQFILISCLFVQFNLVGKAQSPDDSAIARQSYLFDEFINGSVLLKSGELDQAPLNYSAYDQTILFKKDGINYTLTNLENVDTIYIADKKFIPVKNQVFEIATQTGKTDLLISYSSKINPMLASADHDGVTQKNAGQVNNTVTGVYVSRPYKGNYAIEIKKHFWLKNFSSLHKIGTAKEFIRSFKEGSAIAIKEYIQQHHPDLNNQADLTAMLTYCNQL